MTQARKEMMQKMLSLLEQCVKQHSVMFNTPDDRKQFALTHINKLRKIVSTLNKLPDPQEFFLTAARYVLKILGATNDSILASASLMSNNAEKISQLAESPITHFFIRNKANVFKAFNMPKRMKSMMMFSTSEHTEIGNSLKLKMPTNNGSFRKISLDSAATPLFFVGKDGSPVENAGLSLEPGQILALAGDFFGVADKPIAMAQSEAERKSRFVECFNSLACDGDQKEINKIYNILDHQYSHISVLNSYLQEVHLMLLSPGYYKLLSNNYDHFSPWSDSAYEAGHQVAMDMAKRAYSSKQHDDYKGYQQYLQQAYQMDLFASHFLTDSFSSGHMRLGVLRKMLVDQFGVIGNILVNNMHEEDGKGLYARHNGKIIFVEGDDHFDNKADSKNKKAAIEAVQTSVDEVFSVSQTGNIPLKSAAIQDIPQPIAYDKSGQYPQPAPLFINKDGQVQYRDPLDDTNPANVSYKPLTYAHALRMVFDTRVRGVTSSFKPPENGELAPAEASSNFSTFSAVLR